MKIEELRTKIDKIDIAKKKSIYFETIINKINFIFFFIIVKYINILI